MPRNLNKRLCQTPGCRAFAMHQLPDGTPANHCRSHLDHLLGPRTAGAPKGNLNAVKTGRYANPLSKKELQTIAHTITEDPQQTPAVIFEALHAVHQRTRDPFLTLALLSRLAQQLIPYIADQRFHKELNRLLEEFPPQARPEIESVIWKETIKLTPLDRLKILRDAVSSLQDIAVSTPRDDALSSDKPSAVINESPSP